MILRASSGSESKCHLGRGAPSCRSISNSCTVDMSLLGKSFAGPEQNSLLPKLREQDAVGPLRLSKWESFPGFLFDDKALCWA